MEKDQDLFDDNKYLWNGVPGLSDRDQRKVEEGNQLFLVMVRLIEICMAENVVVTLENPATSRVWLLQKLKNLAKRYNATYNVLRLLPVWQKLEEKNNFSPLRERLSTQFEAVQRKFWDLFKDQTPS